MMMIMTGIAIKSEYSDDDDDWGSKLSVVMVTADPGEDSDDDVDDDSRGSK